MWCAETGSTSRRASAESGALRSHHSAAPRADAPWPRPNTAGCRRSEQIEHPELADDARFRTNSDRVEHRSALDEILEPLFRGRAAEYWALRLSSVGIPCGYPLSWPGLRHHEQALSNEYLIDVETAAWGTVTTGGPAWHFSATPQRWSGTPMPGQHADDILDELRSQRRVSTSTPAETARDR